MMYWLIIFLFDGDTGEFLLRHELAVKNREVCEQVREDYTVREGFIAYKTCVSDEQLKQYKR